MLSKAPLVPCPFKKKKKKSKSTAVSAVSREHQRGSVTKEDMKLETNSFDQVGFQKNILRGIPSFKVSREPDTHAEKSGNKLAI